VRHVNLVQLYEDNREKLLLNWHIGQNADRRIEIKGSNSYGADPGWSHQHHSPGATSGSRPGRVRLGHAHRERRFGQMFADLLSAKPPAVIVADG
jgi:HPr kinase/phosphorylase